MPSLDFHRMPMVQNASPAVARLRRRRTRAFHHIFSPEWRHRPQPRAFGLAGCPARARRARHAAYPRFQHVPRAGVEIRRRLRLAVVFPRAGRARLPLGGRPCPWSRPLARLQSPHPAFPWRTVRRLGVVWLIGYALHLPWSGTRAAWTAFLATDVLQCLAASLVAITALEFPLARLLPPKARRAAAIAMLGALALASIFLAPSAKELSCGWFLLDAYTDTTGLSLFPLLPWFGFVAIGVLGAAVPVRWNWLIIALAAAACFCPQPEVFSKVAPAFFVQRLGFLVVGAQAVAWAAGRWTAPGWLVWRGASRWWCMSATWCCCTGFRGPSPSVRSARRCK